MSRNADRFVALPRVNGDAFLYERWTNTSASQPLTVFVDGGLTPRDLRAQLRCEINNRPISVLIVTHGDDDHTRGAQCILMSSRRVDELWLPASLEPVMTEMLLRPRRLPSLFLRAVRRQPESVGEILQGIRGRDVRDVGFAQFQDREPNETEAGQDERDGWGKDVWSELLSRQELFEATDAPRRNVNARIADDWQDVFTRERVHDAQYAFSDLKRVLEGLSTDHLQELRLSRRDVNLLVNGARRIAALAGQAVARRDACRVRWFDVARFLDGLTASGGLRDTLRPLNAVEVNAAEARRLPAGLSFANASEELLAVARLALAFLSPSNAYGVVFEAPSSPQHPGVIFSGDSDFFAPRGHNRVGLWPSPSSILPVPNTAPTWALSTSHEGEGQGVGTRGIHTLVTAPHHGSPSNDRAYFALSRWLGADAFGLVRGTSSRVKRVSECLQSEAPRVWRRLPAL